MSTRDTATIDDLADAHLLAPVPAAPDWWINFVAPLVTPSGHPIARSARFVSLPEVLCAVGANAGVSLTTHYVAGHVARTDVVFLPLTGVAPCRFAIDASYGLLHHRLLLGHQRLDAAFAEWLFDDVFPAFEPLARGPHLAGDGPMARAEDA